MSAIPKKAMMVSILGGQAVRSLGIDFLRLGCMALPGRPCNGT